MPKVIKNICLALLCATILLASLNVAEAHSYRRHKAFYSKTQEVINGDTAIVLYILPIYVFPTQAELRKFERMVRNIKVVYPLAKEAKEILDEAEKRMAGMSKRERAEYSESVEELIVEKYTPVVEKLTFSQGKVLIKLIDRETNTSSYQWVQELRGKMSAFLWQGLAKIFGADLKQGYDKYGDDWLMEEIIIQYEAGLI